MLKKARLQVSEVKAVGMKPIAKAVDVDFDRKSTYKQFCDAIKQKFPPFDSKSYIIYFDKMAGITLNRHNFPEFLQGINAQVNRYGEAHIHKNIVETSFGFTNVSSSSSDEDEDDKVIQTFAAMVDDDDMFASPQRKAFLHKAFLGDPTDPSLKLKQEDCKLLQNLQVVTKPKPPLFSLTEMKANLVTHIVKSLQEV